jgi:hypothetical protein
MNDNALPLDRAATIVDNIDQIARIRERIAILAILEEELNHVSSQLELDLLARIKGQIDHRQKNGLR